MTMRSNFAAFILSYGRPDRIPTLKELRKSGYTGRVVILCSDDDATLPEYQERYGDMVHVFNKASVAAHTDDGDNSGDMRVVVYARNYCHDLARQLGVDYFVELDDDYVHFRHKRTPGGRYDNGMRCVNLDAVFDAMVDFVAAAPWLAVALSQGGDFIGGAAAGGWRRPKRKAMNSFVCATERPFKFVGRVNEDVSTYVVLGSRGGLFLTLPSVALQQWQTQQNPGGLTETYRDNGTYVKSFYSVMYHPSSVRVSVIQQTLVRIHHQVRWRFTVPAILSPSHRRVEASS